MSDFDETTGFLKNAKLTQDEIEAIKTEQKNIQNLLKKRGMDLPEYKLDPKSTGWNPLSSRDAALEHEIEQMQKLSKLERPGIPSQPKKITRPWIDPEGVKDIDLGAYRAAIAQETAKREALKRMLRGVGVGVGGAVLEHLAFPPEAGRGSDVPVGPALTEEEMLNLLKRRSNK